MSGNNFGLVDLSSYLADLLPPIKWQFEIPANKIPTHRAQADQVANLLP